MIDCSVIIPVYNAEEYLRQCLDSVLSQTLRDIEIICVDDGSTDRGPAILAEYAAKDGRVCVIAQNNAGQGAARNRGLEVARGEYVYFMDADDELASHDVFERLSGVMSGDSLDVLFFDAKTVVDDDVVASPDVVNPKDYLRNGDYSGVYSGRELFSRFLKANEYCVSPCLAIFRRSFLDGNSLCFPEARLFYEDNIFMTSVMLAAERASHRPWRLYIRKVHAGSTVTGRLSDRHLGGYRACYDDVCALLKRGGWDSRTSLALKERKMVYLRQIHRLEGSRRPLTERFYGLYICLRCRGISYIVKRAFQLLCLKFR